MPKEKFEALAAVTKSGRPTLRQVADNGGLPSNLRSEIHEYDSNRPQRQVMSRYSK